MSTYMPIENPDNVKLCVSKQELQKNHLVYPADDTTNNVRIKHSKEEDEKWG